MATSVIKWNERAWAGQLISWIKSAIEKKVTIFQDATNDSSVKMETGRTKFPDVLLFTDKVSGIVFNGWELKFPDTPVDDLTMLENALEKAKKLHSDSFVTWNGSETVIWRVNKDDYSVNTLSRIKTYSAIPTISTRDDLADPIKYASHEPVLRQRLLDILHDLEELYLKGELRPAINVSGNIMQSIKAASQIIIPQFQKAITEEKGCNVSFRNAYNQWKIYESSTLKILATSSRKEQNVIPEQVLAKFTFYNLIGKILFYLTLSENLSGELNPIEVSDGDAKALLNHYFEAAKNIDYQAIFKPYFTDEISYSSVTNKAIINMLRQLTAFDFRILPSAVIGYVLENLVPAEEKQRFGQYFTPEVLAYLVAYPVVKDRNSYLFDPTSGTGTFLNVFYHLLRYYGNTEHTNLLNHIWGNDVSHFPAILSVINLYKQDVTQTDNFPRVMRDDFFKLYQGQEMVFPDSHDYKKHLSVNIPLFDGIASNFPFIQQEDIPNEVLTAYFRSAFQETQRAFLKSNTFSINERSDYFTYCVYNSIRFLKEDGCLSAVTSNAWLGKEYGLQFKKFLLDNFHIKYIVKSNAEHWFTDSQVSTIFFVASREKSDEPTRFVTICDKMSNLFGQVSIEKRIEAIEDIYSQIDICERIWERDVTFLDLYRRRDNTCICCIVPKQVLVNSLKSEENWATYFTSAHIFESIAPCLTQYASKIVRVIRGERTGWNPMFVIPSGKVCSSRISDEYLVPYIKSPSELQSIESPDRYSYYAFICTKEIDELDEGTRLWIDKFVNAKNKNGSQTIPEACAGHKPFWYTLNPKKAHIITAINPYKRFFFSYSADGFTIDQRLIGLQVQNGYDVELIAALLNSAVTFLTLELKGTSRNLGALDLNANYLKRLRLLNPDLLSPAAKQEIKVAFVPLKHRCIGDIADEVRMADRIHFDKTVLHGFGLDTEMLPLIYDLLVSSVNDRVTMAEK